jgi:hypothetical protein
MGPCRPPITGSPFVTWKPSLGIAALSEKALALIRWQPVQWQAIVSSGGAVILSRTWPQRHPPSQGKLHLLIVPLEFGMTSPGLFDPRCAAGREAFA